MNLRLRSIASALLLAFVVYSTVLSLYSQHMAYGQERTDVTITETVTIVETVTSTTTITLIKTITTTITTVITTTTTTTLISTVEKVVTQVVTAFQTIERTITQFLTVTQVTEVPREVVKTVEVTREVVTPTTVEKTVQLPPPPPGVLETISPWIIALAGLLGGIGITLGGRRPVKPPPPAHTADTEQPKPKGPCYKVKVSSVYLHSEPDALAVNFDTPPLKNGEEVIDITDPDSKQKGYRKVRTKDGREGWVDMQDVVPCEEWERLPKEIKPQKEGGKVGFHVAAKG
jgi:hypothetical protein